MTWTVCFPEECRDGNFTSLKTGLLKIFNEDPDLIYIPESTVSTTCDEDYTYGAGAYCAIVLISVITFLVIVGTLWEPIAILAIHLKSTATEDRRFLVNDAHDDEIVPDYPPPEILNDKPTETSTLGSIKDYLLQNNKYLLDHNISNSKKHYRCFFQMFLPTTNNPSSSQHNDKRGPDPVYEWYSCDEY